MKQINKYSDLKKTQEKIKKHIVKPPFSACVEIYEDGFLNIWGGIILCPDEALRLGKFLVNFYEESLEE